MATGPFRNVYDIDCEITVQPNDSMRFRYVSEGTAGRIYGKNHTNEIPIYPTIKIYNYTGMVYIRLSCVTKGPPDEYRPHPHNLKKLPVRNNAYADRAVCNEGIYELAIENSSDGITFPNLGLHCVKKGDIKGVLETRAKYGVDPFGTGFGHQITSADLHCLRLCFEVFIGKRENPFPHFRLVSNPITDTKDLIIYKLSHVSGAVEGNEEILMFCEKIVKSDTIKIRFIEEQDNQIVWESCGTFGPSDVHKQYGIAFKTPKYRKTDITLPVKVKIRLERTDGDVVTASAPRDFYYKPNETVSAMQQKRRRPEERTIQQLNDLGSPQSLLQPSKPYINDLNLLQFYQNFGPNNINIPGPPSGTSQQFFQGPKNINIPGLSSDTSMSMDSSNNPSRRYNITVPSPNKLDPEEQLKIFENILRQKHMEDMQKQQPILTSEETDQIDSGEIMEWLGENGPSSIGGPFNRF